MVLDCLIYRCLKNKVTTGGLSSAEECFCRGLELYLRQEFDEAVRIFGQGMEGDPLCRVFLARCMHFQEHPPPPDWDGIWISLEK